jgi:hypothetical protein
MSTAERAALVGLLAGMSTAERAAFFALSVSGQKAYLMTADSGETMGHKTAQERRVVGDKKKKKKKKKKKGKQKGETALGFLELGIDDSDEVEGDAAAADTKQQLEKQVQRKGWRGRQYDEEGKQEEEAKQEETEEEEWGGVEEDNGSKKWLEQQRDRVLKEEQTRRDVANSVQREEKARFAAQLEEQERERNERAARRARRTSEADGGKRLTTMADGGVVGGGVVRGGASGNAGRKGRALDDGDWDEWGDDSGFSLNAASTVVSGLNKWRLKSQATKHLGRKASIADNFNGPQVGSIAAGGGTTGSSTGFSSGLTSTLMTQHIAHGAAHRLRQSIDYGGSARRVERVGIELPAGKHQGEHYHDAVQSDHDQYHDAGRDTAHKSMQPMAMQPMAMRPLRGSIHPFDQAAGAAAGFGKQAGGTLGSGAYGARGEDIGSHPIQASQASRLAHRAGGVRPTAGSSLARYGALAVTSSDHTAAEQIKTTMTTVVGLKKWRSRAQLRRSGGGAGAGAAGGKGGGTPPRLARKTSFSSLIGRTREGSVSDGISAFMQRQRPARALQGGSGAADGAGRRTSS